MIMRLVNLAIFVLTITIFFRRWFILVGFTGCRALQGHIRFEASCQEWTVLIEDKNSM